MIEIHDDEYILLKEYLKDCCGIDVPSEKIYLFKTRLSDLLREEGFSTFKDLFVHLKSEKEKRLQKRLIEFMTTNETSFFRDEHPYETLKNVILPEIALKKKSESIYFPPKLRIWSAGCSTGQEPYSISIIIQEWIEEDKTFSPENISIIATDISSEVVNRARSGIYSNNEIRKGMNKQLLEKYFYTENDKYIVKQDVKKTILFNELNLSTEFENSMGKFDIIFCRNVMIYFAKTLKQSILSQFHTILNPGGNLVLGASETLYHLSEKFESAYHGESTLYRVIK